MPGRVLVLGGTGEATELAGELTASGLRVISSLAGRVGRPRLPAGESRIGGFGGPEGLAAWLRSERVDMLIDATHPFAAAMTDSAVRAAATTSTPLLVLRRPGWTSGPGDDWRRVPSLTAAADLLSTMDVCHVFLTTGRQSVQYFTELERHQFLVRAVEAPSQPHPPRMTTVLERGPFTVEGESALLREHRIDVMVTKDSGGPATRPKLDAARDLGLPVIVVDRPEAPQVDTVDTVAEALAHVRHAMGVTLGHAQQEQHENGAPAPAASERLQREHDQAG